MFVFFIGFWAFVVMAFKMIYGINVFSCFLGWCLWLLQPCLDPSAFVGHQVAERNGDGPGGK